MAKPKIIAVSITALKATSEDEWMDKWIKYNGDSVMDSPHYHYLIGDYLPLHNWMEYRHLKYDYITDPLMRILESIIKNGQISPIKIYNDMRINTGHKRAACMLFLGYKTIKAEIVLDSYKL